MKNIKRIAAALLAVCLVLTGIPFATSAIESNIVYDFGTLRTAVSGYTDANSNNKPDLEESVGLVNTAYNKKTIDINYESYTPNFSASLLGSDFRTYSHPGQYIAFRMRKSATDIGDYTVSMYHAVNANGGYVDLHILPVGTSDIPGALNSDNCVGRLDFNGGNEYTDPADPANKPVTEVLGYHTFGSETEFLVVFNLVEGSPFNPGNCYTFLQELILTPGTDTPISAPRRMDPMVVSDGPVEYFETVVYAAAGQAGDHYNLYLPIEGDRMNVYNLETREKVTEVVTPFDVCRGITVDKDGIVWMIGSNPVVFKYDPFTNTTVEYSSFKGATEDQASSGFYLFNTDEYLYFGTYEGAHIVRFTKASGEYRVYGVGGLYAADDTEKENDYLADAAYSCGVAVDTANGFLYCGVSGDKDKDGIESYDVLKIDVDSGYVLGSVALDNLFEKSETMFRGMGLTSDGKTLFAGASGCMGMISINTDTMQTFTPTDASGNTAYNKINYDVARMGTDTYMSLGSTGARLDENGNCITYASGSKDLLKARFYKWVEDDSYPNNGYFEQAGTKNIAMRCGQNSYAKIGGQDCLVYFNSSGLAYYDIENDTTVSLESMIDREADGAPILLQTLETDAAGNLYMGTFNTSKCRVYDITQKKLTDAFYTSGQTDSLVWYEGQLYAGNYNTARLTRVNFDLQNSTDEGKYNDYLLGMKDHDDVTNQLENSPVDGEIYDLHQSRVHAIAAGGDKVFIGTIPDLYEFGGTIGWYDLTDGSTFATRFPDANGDGISDGVLENQSIIKLVYADGYLYGITSISGGSGTAEQNVNMIQAKLFVYDVANKAVVFESNLQSELSAKGYTLANQKAIASLELDPDGDKLWCIAGPYLFDFTYANGAITIGSVAEYGTDSLYSGHKARKMVFDDDYIYAGFSGTTGMRQISRSDISECKILPVPVTSYYAIAGDGNLYYTVSEKLYMYPLNVTADDQSAASAVVTRIAALPVGDAVTLADEADIRAAQSAYDGLSTTQRALVRNYYLLQDAHIDLLEAKINALDNNSTATEVAALMNEYKALSTVDKAKVKNYTYLKAAYDTGVAIVFGVGDAGFANIGDAIAAAAQLSAGNRVITLLANTTEDSVILTDGVSLDLNGLTLTVNSLSADIANNADGYVIDSSVGNNGVLAVAQDTMILHSDNPDMPLYDATAGGYRFFDYKLELHSSTTNVGVGREKFWFKFHFYTDDTCAVLDQNAYALVQAGDSGLQISTRLTWQGAELDPVYFGDTTAEYETADEAIDVFSQKWATGATENRWLYITVSGLDKVKEGTLLVMPTITANGVEVTNGAIEYIKEAEKPDYGWSEGGPFVN